MPELPEVQTVVHGLKEAGVEGLSIRRVHVYWHKTAATPALAEFCRDAKILKIERRAKFIKFHLSSGFLYIHLRMTGKLFFASSSAHDPYERIRFDLSDGRSLCFQDIRKFARCYFAEDDIDFEKQLGSEPLQDDFSFDRFKQLIGHRKQAIKALLFDQSVIAGLGNIYIDEALWLAKIHPLRQAGSLNNKELHALHQAIPTVLKAGIEQQGTTLGRHQGNYLSVARRPGNNQQHLKVFRRTGEACPRCGHIIEKSRVAGRGTHICPHCQR